MNVQKTNKLGLAVVEKGFKGKPQINIEYQSDQKSESGGFVMVNVDLTKHSPNAKIIRVSKSIMEACKLIDINSIKENIDQANFNFKSLYILLDNDKSGLIKIERFGSDFGFILLSNLHLDEIEVTYNSYSFITKEFSVDRLSGKSKDFLEDKNLYNYETSVFVVQLITYLIYGDITERNIPKKQSIKVGFSRFLNNSSLNIAFCDTLWKQRINVEGFKVKGHFRLQPIGEKKKKRKLIWIEEFDKKGYNRKSTVEIQSNKK